MSQVVLETRPVKPTAMPHAVSTESSKPLGSIFVPQTPLSESGFISWISQASADQAIAYHEGWLTCDRSQLASHLCAKERARLHALAQRVWCASELGIVHLYSQRLGEGRFRYLAIRSHQPLSPAQIRTQLRKTAVRSTPSSKS